MSGKFALIIGNTEYSDPGLAQLTAPGKDVEDFARVIKDTNICAFDDVRVLFNELSSSVIEAIDEFFDQKKPDDLLVLYFSGHGVRDELGALYLTARNTIRTRLRSTAVKSDYIRDAMNQSRSKRQVIILDCCNSGAFPQGMKAELGGTMGMISAFQGYGRYVLTASDEIQFAWEGNKIIGETDNSLFTHFLLKGLEGEADSNSDGRITVDELYDYAYEQISRVTPKQTPRKDASKQEGEIVLRQITRIEDIKPIALADDLLSEIEDLRPYVREAAVQKLEKIIKGKNIGLARSAMEALEKIVVDDNTTRRVAQMATQVLESVRQAEQKAEEERKASEEAERLAALRAEEERLAREKAEAERRAKEETEKLLKAKAAREAAELEAAWIKAEREAVEKAAHEAAKKAAQEKAEKESAEQAAIQRAELEAMELAARRKAEREKAEKAEREAMELAARRKAERDAAEKAAQVSRKTATRASSAYSPMLRWAPVVMIGLCAIAASVWGISYLGKLVLPPATRAPGGDGSTAFPTDPGGAESAVPSSEELVSGITSKDPTTLVSIQATEPRTLDPALAYEPDSSEIIQNVYETLVFYDGAATDKFVPMLAESWDVSEDGKTYTFKIRSGVKFHNGADLTASDVAYSFQRGLLYGGYSGPQWLLAEPFFGVGIDDVSLLVDSSGSLADDQPALASASSSDLRAACDTVTRAITANDSAGTVTMKLSQSWGPFLATISQSWGSIMDRDWTIENGGWDGSCDTWQNFYAVPTEDNPFNRIANGTGAFKLDSWTSGDQLVLARNDNYWRAAARLERVVIQWVDEWSTRFAALQAGDADVVQVPPENRSQVDELVGERCEFDLAANAYKACTVVDHSQPLRLYLGRPSSSSQDIFFTFQIADSSTYVGSGKLDGEGIPRDFFSDVHVRRGFAYSFDLDSYIQEIYNGEAVQQPVLARAGMPGYDRNAPVYTFDLGKAEEEFKLADVDKDGVPAGQDPEGDIWTNGFRLQALYNVGNTSRETVSKLLARNLSAVNGLFVVETVGLPWPDFLLAMRASEAPYFVSGWVEDIHDPHNWYYPYMVGTYALRQALPEELRVELSTLLDQGVSETDPAKRDQIYKEMNQLYYQQVPALLLAASTSHAFEQRWVLGRITNPLFAGNYYYSMYKE